MVCFDAPVGVERTDDEDDGGLELSFSFSFSDNRITVEACVRDR